MITAPIPPNESERLAALREYAILDSGSEASYDEIATMASYICNTPIAMMSLVDETRQWFKSKVGLEQTQTSRDIAFCAHGILNGDLMEIPDTTKDERFVDNPLVRMEPRIRFYAGVPLRTPEGHALGMLCVVDHRPRRLNNKQRRALKALSSLVMTLMESRRVTARLAGALEEVKVLRGLLPICMHCKKVRDDCGYWNEIEVYVSRHTEAEFTHGVCPACVRKHYPELGDEQPD